MRKLFKHLKPYAATIAAIVVILIVQAYCDLSLPSYTSRPQRPGDINGQTYCFVTKEEFEKMLENDEFYEYDVHHNNYYGTSKKF